MFIVLNLPPSGADVHAAILEGDIPTPAEIERRLADAAEG